MKTRSIMAVAVFATLLGGCPAVTDQNARRDPSWYRVVVEPLHSNTDRALKFYDQVSRLKDAELARELDTARRTFEADKSELNRIQLAMLLSLPGSGFRDDGAAIVLLQAFVHDKSLEDSSLRPLALLLHTDLTELKRLDEALQQQTLKSRDEQRRAEALQQKLEAILEMEMKMIQREQAVSPKKK